MTLRFLRAPKYSYALKSHRWKLTKEQKYVFGSAHSERLKQRPLLPFYFFFFFFWKQKLSRDSEDNRRQRSANHKIKGARGGCDPVQSSPSGKLTFIRFPLICSPLIKCLREFRERQPSAGCLSSPSANAETFL